LNPLPFLFAYQLAETKVLSDIHFSAYALGDLEPPYSAESQWIASSREGAIEGIALEYHGLIPPVVFLMGSSPAISALLMSQTLPQLFSFASPLDIDGLLACYYKLSPMYQMYRMRTNKGIYVGLSSSDRKDIDCTILTEQHGQEIQDLLDEAARIDERDLRDIAYHPSMLKDGYYRGIYQEGRLIAVAGTHMVANQSRMAAIGNVAVHPEFRRRGLGTIVSDAVTKSLIANQFDLIVLNVRQNNLPALRLYRKLGYRQVTAYIEGIATRK
jgi:ribosomal protein S18 acetylase RimI-like enzyme